MIEIVETWGQFIYWFPHAALAGVAAVAIFLIAALALRQQQIYADGAAPRVSRNIWLTYGIYTPNGWLTAPDKVSNCPGSLSLKLREIWLIQGPSTYDWVVAEIPPDAGPPAQEAIVLQRCTKPPGLGECGEVCGTDYRG